MAFLMTINLARKVGELQALILNVHYGAAQCLTNGRKWYCVYFAGHQKRSQLKIQKAAHGYFCDKCHIWISLTWVVGDVCEYVEGLWVAVKTFENPERLASFILKDYYPEIRRWESDTF
ncbi:unnamed protein product [Caretta caretta]